MSAVLYALGILIGTAGLMAIGFAVAIREFNLGNALIMAGATAVVGGLTLIGLGAVIRELARLRSALEKAAQFMRPAESLPPRVATARGPAPPRPSPAGAPRAPRMESPVEAPVPRAAEPARQDALPDVRQDLHQDLRAPARPGLFASIRGGRSDARAAEARDAAAPSPAPLESPAREEARFEPKFGSALLAEGAPTPATLATRTAARFDAPRPMPEPPIAPARPARNLFDTVWPNDSKAATELAPTAPAIGTPPPPPDHEDFHRPTNEEPAPRHSEPMPPPMPEERPGILKSGVIDGMAYTLYIDGSIEAQLPQGLIRFASIDELRAHLENNNA